MRWLMSSYLYTLNPILYQVNKYSYLCQFAAQTVETWQAYSPTGNTPAAIKVLFTWQLILFQSPPTWFQYGSDFQLKNAKRGHKLELAYLYCLLEYAYEAPFTNMKMEHWRWPEMPLILGRSGTQYITMVTKLFSSYCGAPLVESYCKESNISDTNWLRYFFFIIFDQDLFEYMTSSLG